MTDYLFRGALAELDPDVREYFPDSESVNKALRRLVAPAPQYRRREHAGYFRGKSRKYKARDELFVVEKLIESMVATGEDLYHSLEISPSDPPDCIAKDQSGKSVGFEVTELVDEDKVALASRGQRKFRYWEMDDIIESVTKILREKDSIDYSSQGYSKTILIIYTDEYMIRYKDIIDHIRGHRFPRLRRIDEVYLLFSYDPDEEICPYVRLDLVDPQR